VHTCYDSLYNSYNGTKIGPLSVLRSWAVFRTRKLGRFLIWRDQKSITKLKRRCPFHTKSWTVFRTREMDRLRGPEYTFYLEIDRVSEPREETNVAEECGRRRAREGGKVLGG